MKPQAGASPRIQYAKTEDGVDIAYCVQGEGPPLLYLSELNGDMAGETELDDMVRWYERIGRTHTLVRYDPRGSGSSDRKALSESLEACFQDADTVANAAPFDRFDILAIGSSVRVAIVFAARRPERVNRLILWGGSARSTDRQLPAGVVATRALIDKDWRTYTNAWAQTLFGWSNAEKGRAWARYYQRATGPENVLAFLASLEEFDLTDVLPQVRASTLVVDHRVQRVSRSEAARFIATAIADARLVVREGQQLPPWAERGGVEGPAALIDEFTGVVAATTSAPDGMTAILFLDIADSTALTTKLGDAAYRNKERELDASLRGAITEAGGTPLKGKLLGDGILSVYKSAKDAISAALRCRDLGNQADLPLHLGIHAGDVIHEENDVRGGAVQLASRVQSKAEPGEILVSDTVRSLARTSAGVAFDDRGEHELKGIAEPQRLFAVRTE
ncbi:MAG: hypothetical protein IIC91_03335 [Chloroflexi bacterium]|nr:hypothetical protein [Chloroflexota bacterium]